MGDPQTAGVLDDGTGVYLWNGDTRQLGEKWVFMGLYRCERCGRSVTLVRFATHDAGRLFVRHKQCPGGCESVHAWLEPAVT